MKSRGDSTHPYLSVTPDVPWNQSVRPLEVRTQLLDSTRTSPMNDVVRQLCGSNVVWVFLSNRFFFSSPGMAFAVAYNTPNIRFWRSSDRCLKKTSWSLAGALTCLLQRGFAGTVSVHQICSVNSLSLSRLSPLFPLVSWVIISWRTSLLMSCPIVCSSSNWSSVSVIPPTPRTITFNASSNKCV